MAQSAWFVALSMALIVLTSGNGFSATTTARDIVLLLDNSGNMGRHDPQFLIRRAATDFLQSVPERTRVAIAIFDQKAHLVAPLTSVTELTRDSLSDKLEFIDYRGHFTNSAAGMERAIYELTRHGHADSQKIVIFVTDGIINTGNPARDRELTKWMCEALTDEAAAAAIRIFVIAVTEAANFQIIQTLTFKTGGTYFRAMVADDIGVIFEQLNAVLRRDETLSARMVPPTEPAARSHLKQFPPNHTHSGFAVPSSAASATHQSFERPTLESPKPEHTTSSPVTAQSALLERKPMPTLKSGPAMAVAPSAPKPTEVIPKANSLGTHSVQTWILTPSLWAIIACGVFAVLVVVVITTLAKRKKHGGRPNMTSFPTSPLTTQYPPPFCLLKDLSGATHRENHDITGRLTRISRASAEDSSTVRTLVIKDDYISREHAVVEYRNYSYWLIDRGSINGTFVNDERVTSERLLKHGDRLRFHTYEFEVVLPEMEGEAETRLAEAAASIQDQASTFQGKNTARVAAPTNAGTELDRDNREHVVKGKWRIS